MKKAIIKYAEGCLKRLRKLLQAAVKSEDQQILHDIRVEIKKLKALLQLMHYHRNTFDDDTVFSRFRSIFRAVAEIREPYVMNAFALRFTGEALPDLAINDTLVENFRKDIPLYLKQITKQKRKILKELKRFKGKTYKKYLKKRKEELRHELFPAFNKKELHNDRKQIKEILYLTQIAKSKRKINPFYESSAELIGEWHDKVIFVEQMKTTKSNKSPLLKTLRSDITNDLKKLKEEVNKHYTSSKN